MRTLRRFLARLVNLVMRRRDDARLNEEIEEHLALQIAENIRAGLSPAEARRQAKLKFGAVEAMKEDYRAERGLLFIETFLQDLRYAARMLRRSPGFTTVAVLTLALGIGANTTIFSLINAIALRSLPVPNPQQLFVILWTARDGPDSGPSYFYSGCPTLHTDSGMNESGCSFSYPMFHQILSGQNLFSGVFAFAPRGADLKVNGRTSQLQGAFVSGEFFPTLGTRAVIGRMLDPLDDVIGAQPVIVLSYAHWQDQLGGDSNIIGKTAIVNRKPCRIVGVAQKGFQLNPGVPEDYWLPLAVQPDVDPVLPNRTSALALWLELMGRLKPGASPARAAAALTTVFAPGATTGPDSIFKPQDGPRIVLTNAAQGLSTLREEFSTPLLILMTAVSLILLIACANVAGLMLARSASREKEMAVRRTLGAGRWRLIRQLLTESTLISAAGGLIGVLLAALATKPLTYLLSGDWPSQLQIDVSIDRRVLLFTLVISLVVGILSGLAPALHGSRADVTPSLKESGAYSSATPKQWFLLNNALVAAQVAISIVVLSGTGLLVRTLTKLRSVDVGFDTHNVLLFTVDMTLSGYKLFDDPRSYPVERDLQNRLSSLPGVAFASYSMTPLLSRANMDSQFNLAGLPRSSAFRAEDLPVGPGFFETMRIPLIAGREFSAVDFESSAKPEPIVVNQSFARKLFGDQNPLGRGICDLHCDKAQWQIVGVVRDAKYSSLRAEIAPTVYTLLRTAGPAFEVRANGDPRALIPLVRHVVEQVDPNFLVADMRTQSEQINQLLYQERSLAALSSLFGVLAVILASIGLYGLLAYGVVRRTHEIGVRMALGAQQHQIFWLIGMQGLLLTLTGIVAGLALAVGLTRFLQTLLFGVRPTDPWTFASMAILLSVVATLACYVPARRAMRVDPMVALRYE